MANDASGLLAPRGEIEMIIVYSANDRPIEAYSNRFPLQRTSHVRDRSARRRYVTGVGDMVNREVNRTYKRLGNKAEAPAYAIAFIIEVNAESDVVMRGHPQDWNTLSNVKAATKLKLAQMAADEFPHPISLT